MDDTTNQVAAEDMDASTLAADDGVTQNVQTDDDGNPIEVPEEEEEIELDGDLKLKLKKAEAEAVKQHILRQADYTRKTQELSEQRKAFESERQALSQADGEELTARANINLIDRQLTQYANVNWAQAFDTDPFEAQKAFAQYQLLQQGRQQTQTFIEQRSQERTNRQQQETATRIQEGAAELARDIPNWSPDLSAKLQEFGNKAFGLTKNDFDSVTDPRAVKLLHAAYQWSQHQETQKKAQTLQKQQEIQPAATPGKKGSAPVAGLDDGLSTAEWIRRREAQVAKGRKR